MSYTKNTWVNDATGGTAGASGGKLNQGRLNHMETGIEGAHTTADAAAVTASAAIPKSLVTTAGDIIYATASSVLARLGLGAAGTVLKGGASAPSYGKVTSSEIDATSDLDNNARVGVRKNSAGSTFERRRVNFVEGSNITLTVADDSGDEEIDVTIAATAGSTVYRKVTEKDVVNTVVETDLLNGEITIGAGVLSTDKTARVKLVGDYLNNSAGTRDLTVRIKLGATTLWGHATTGPAMSADVDRRAWELDFGITNLNAANSQWLGGLFRMGDGAAGSVAGLGQSTGTLLLDAEISGTAAEDTSTAKVLAVTVVHSFAHANLSMRLKSALVEIV